MKKVLAPFILLATLVACQDNTKEILNTIDGRWQVNAVTYANRTGLDSVATATNAFLTFDACSKKANNTNPDNCAVTYQTGNQAYPFTYQAGDRSKAVSINPTAQPTASAYNPQAGLIAGGYDIVTLTEHELVLRKQLYDKNKVGTFIQISATK